MASMRDIRRRIKSVASTEKITKAMKMVSAAKLRKVQGSLVAIRPYADKVQEVMDHILAGDGEYHSPMLTPREEVKRVLFVVIAGERGLCGGYNVAVLRKAEEAVRELPAGTDYSLLLVGNKATTYFKTRPYNVLESFTDIGDNPNVTQGKALSDYCIDKYLKEEFDQVHLVYSKFISAMTQQPNVAQVLPIPVTQNQEPADDHSASASDYIFEPQETKILDMILPKYVYSTIYHLLLESKAGEHGARMTAMGAATDNAKEVIGKLTLSLNRARQAAITTEISEIVGGAAALE